jgi:hypothetical protein
MLGPRTRVLRLFAATLFVALAAAAAAAADTAASADATAAAAAAEGLLSGTDSDYMLLRTGSTSLPFASGEGVFAKRDIPASTILCEYRGPVILKQYSNQILDDKKLDIEIDGVDYIIVGNTLCAKINDCANILERKQVLDDLGNEDMTVDFIPYEGYTYNSVIYAHYGKMFIVSTKDIKAGEEIFSSYGRLDSLYLKIHHSYSCCITVLTSLLFVFCTVNIGGLE